MSGKRAKDCGGDGELKEGRGEAWGGRERPPDGAPAGGDSGDQLVGYGLNWDGGLLEEVQREEVRVLVWFWNTGRLCLYRRVRRQCGHGQVVDVDMATGY